MSVWLERQERLRAFAILLDDHWSRRVKFDGPYRGFEVWD